MAHRRHTNDSGAIGMSLLRGLAVAIAPMWAVPLRAMVLFSPEVAARTRYVPLGGAPLSPKPPKDAYDQPLYCHMVSKLVRVCARRGHTRPHTAPVQHNGREHRAPLGDNMVQNDEPVCLPDTCAERLGFVTCLSPGLDADV